MQPTVRVLAEARKPLIRFLGRRQWPSSTEQPHPHPGAPPEIKNTFGDFVKKIQASESATASSGTKAPVTKGTNAYGEFWEAPNRFWQPRVRTLEEAEVDAILSGGASLW